MNILIVGPSWIGDMVMSQSLYTVLKQKYPNAKIDVLAPGWCRAIVERMPEVNQVIEMPVGHGAVGISTRWKLARELKRNNYDHAYVLPHSIKSALIPWFAGIATRTGWKKREPRAILLNDQRHNIEQYTYMVERYCALAYSTAEQSALKDPITLASLPKATLSIDPNVQQQVTNKFSLVKEPHIVGLCPGAEFGPAKKWPEENYAQVANAIAKQGRQVWLFGSEKDKATCDKILSLVNEQYQHKITVLAGETSLIEAVDLIACCETIVANDSGLMHVAAAVNCNVVAIYGSTSPNYTPPNTDKKVMLNTNIECRPCFKRECQYGHLKCLTEISAQRVLEAIESLSSQSL